MTANPAHVRRNLSLLALCQAAGMSNNTMVISMTALVGAALAPAPGLATLPFGLQWLAVMATVVPASLFMKRYGRRAGHSLAAVFGMGSGLLGCWAILQGSFALFCLAAVGFGVSIVGVQFYRFSAADAAGPAFRSRAISLVLAGGVVAGIVGPQLAKVSKDILPATYAGGYLLIVGLSALCLILLQFTRIPMPSAEERQEGGRPLTVIARQPAFLIAVAAATLGYGVMNLIMTVTPLSMVGHAHDFDSAATVIQWHVVAMFAPSFVTGSLIQRFGVLRIMLAGTALLVACAGLNMAATGAFWEYAVALALLGIGWNFLFVGGTTLLTTVHQPAEKAKVQGLNEFLVFGMVALSSLSSGALHDAAGWHGLNLVVLALTLPLAAAFLWYAAHQRSAAAVQPGE